MKTTSILKTTVAALLLMVAGTTVAFAQCDKTVTLTSKTCDWKVPYKEGKTVVKSIVSGDGGDDKDITVTIEGKAGKVTLTFEAVGLNGKIQVVADKFE